MAHRAWKSTRERDKVMSWFGHPKQVGKEKHTVESDETQIRFATARSFATKVSVDRYNPTVPPASLPLEQPQPVPEPPMPTNGRYEEKYPYAKYRMQVAATLSKHDLLCCGMKEIHGIQYPLQFNLKLNLDNYIPEYQHPADLITQIQIMVLNTPRYRPFWLFSDNNAKNKHAVGDALMQYIIDHKLGSVHRSTEEKNDNSGNKIVVYLWTISRDFLKHKPQPL